MATTDEALDRVASYLGFPLWEPLNKNMRLQFMSERAQYYAGRMGLTRNAHLVNSFLLPASGDISEYPVPEDFNGIYYASSVYTGYYREIGLANPSDPEFFQASEYSPGDSLNATAIALTGSVTGQSIRVFPSGASDEITVWYRVKAPDQLKLNDELPILNQFHLGLVPVATALVCIPHCQWWNVINDQDANRDRNYARQQALLDKGNPNSLPGLLLQQEELFERMIHRVEGASGPSQRILGFGNRRHRMRGMVR